GIEHTLRRGIDEQVGRHAKGEIAPISLNRPDQHQSCYSQSKNMLQNQFATSPKKPGMEPKARTADHFVLIEPTGRSSSVTPWSPGRGRRWTPSRRVTGYR